MSEQNFNGGGIATQEPPAETPDAPVTGSRRNLVIVGIAVAVALLVAVWFLFLSGGGSSTPTGAVPQASIKANGAGQGKTTTGKKTTKKTTVAVKPASDKDTHARDPFKPLLKPSAAASASAPAVTPATPASSPSTPASSPSASVGAPATGNVVATVSLVSINSKAKTATFSVASTGNPTKYSGVAVGKTFATFFKLFDLGTKCAQVQYGDITDSVCMGTPLVVSSAS
jgi:hypothetical protein